MKYIYVLEDEAKFNSQILSALRKSEPDAEIRFFTSMEEFQKWMQLAVQLGNKSLVKGGHRLAEDRRPDIIDAAVDDHLMVLISKDEWLGSRQMPLLMKAQEMLVRKGLCTAEEPTRIVLTAFEGPEFEIKLAEQKNITNVIFKPFDELILQQHLHFAIKGHQLASETFVHVVQVKHEVEMTKEVRMEAVGDVGFVTRSPRPIQIGQISKYYGEVFRGKGRIHVMGRCFACEPHASHKGEYQVWFSYLGIPSHQISDIRRSMLIRNEVEFTQGTFARPQTFKNKWILLDHDLERAKKWRDLLQRTAGVSPDIEGNFEDFIFKSDPMAVDSKQKEKAWSDTPSLKLKVDPATRQILDVEPDSHKSKKIWGLSWKELTQKKLDDFIHPHCAEDWRSYTAAITPKPTTLLLRHGQNRFLLKTVAEPAQKGASHRSFEFIEVSGQEKVIWYNQHFPNPGQAFCIVVSSHFAGYERASFWKEWVAQAKKQGHSPRVIVLFDQVPDEKISREYIWADDIFDNSNEAPYIERKLRFLYFGEDKKQASAVTPFMNACQERIRVANPVEVSEISEAGLVINYYRPISLGSFRQFVLPKAGEETFSEFHTNCNFSAPHPSEKDLFQNHFIFFGVTDGFLKKIRLWILENYVQSKQDATGT